MSTIIKYEHTEDGIRLILESTHGVASVPLSHEERKALGFFLLEVIE